MTETVHTADPTPSPMVTDPWSLTDDERAELEDLVCPLSDPYDLTAAFLVLLGVGPTIERRRDIGAKVRDALEVYAHDHHKAPRGTTPDGLALLTVLGELQRLQEVPRRTAAGCFQIIHSDPAYDRMRADLRALELPQPNPRWQEGVRAKIDENYRAQLRTDYWRAEATYQRHVAKHLRMLRSADAAPEGEARAALLRVAAEQSAVATAALRVVEGSRAALDAAGISCDE